MATKVLKKDICNKCKKQTTYFLIENIDTKLNFENYSLFIDFNINRCNNCGYIAIDLTNCEYEDMCKIVEAPKKEDILNSLKYEIDLTMEYQKNISDKELKLRCLGKILHLENKLFNIYYDKILNKDKLVFKNEYYRILKENARSIINFIDKNFDFEKLNDYFKVLKIESLLFIGEKDKAKEIEINLNLEKDLENYLNDILLIGGTN